MMPGGTYEHHTSYSMAAADLNGTNVMGAKQGIHIIVNVKLITNTTRKLAEIRNSLEVFYIESIWQTHS